MFSGGVLRAPPVPTVSVAPPPHSSVSGCRAATPALTLIGPLASLPLASSIHHFSRTPTRVLHFVATCLATPFVAFPLATLASARFRFRTSSRTFAHALRHRALARSLTLITRPQVPTARTLSRNRRHQSSCVVTKVCPRLFPLRIFSAYTPPPLAPRSTRASFNSRCSSVARTGRCTTFLVRAPPS